MELTLLTEGQVFGDENIKQLEVFKKYGRTCAVTDFAILTGVYVRNSYYTKSSNGLSEKVADSWTKSAKIADDDYFQYDNVATISYDGFLADNVACRRSLIIRPVVALPNKLLLTTNKVANYKGIPIVEYGFYPQTVASKNIESYLNEKFFKNNLEKTINNYTIDLVSCGDLNTPFTPRVISEYIYNNKIYIRFVVDVNCEDEILSDYRHLMNGDIVWIEVSPIRWLYDEETNLLISEKGLVSGIQFDSKYEYNGDFEKTNMYRFLNNYLIKDIFPKELTITVEKGETKLEKLQRDKQKILSLGKRK